MKRQFTSVIERRGEWYIDFVGEIPGVNAPGMTVSEVRRHFKEALALITAANREVLKRATIVS